MGDEPWPPDDYPYQSEEELAAHLNARDAFIRAAGFTAGLLAGLEWAYSQDTLCCHVYGTPTDAVSKAIAHVKATGALPGEAGA